MSTNTLVRSTKVGIVSDAVVVAHTLSNDMLISYINFMRQSMGLPPMRIEPDLGEEARRRKEYALAHNHIEIQHDRSVFSISQDGATTWMYERRLPVRSPFRIKVPPFDSDAYLSYILSPHYDAIGIARCDADDSRTPSFTVQVFGGHTASL